MSILNHPSWHELRPYVRLEQYGRDTGSNGPRIRIEVLQPSDGRLARMFLALTMPCVACHKLIHPIRQREGHGHWYYAATCPLEKTFSCARGRAARQEYLLVRKAIGAIKTLQEPALPGLLT